jgi:hypothetical protein
MAKKKLPVIGMEAPVTVTAGADEGEKKGPATFETTFYTGGALDIAGWDMPVVVDLAGLDRGNVLVANLDHDRTKRVGNFDVINDGKSLVAHGTATAKTAARDEVVGSAAEGYQWQSSLEVNPREVEEVKAGKSVTVNGQSFTGPLFVTRKGTLKGFAFVSHGADDNTTVSIAASAASTGGSEMKAEVKAWAEEMGIDVENASEEQLATIEANYAGRSGKKSAQKAASNPFEAAKLEAERRMDIKAIADRFLEKRPGDIEYIEQIRKLHDHAIEANMLAQEFRTNMYEIMFADARPIPTGANSAARNLSNRILEAALCQSGKLPSIEKHFSDQELQYAHDRFKGTIGLNQFILLCAESSGYRSDSASRVTLDAQRAAFHMTGQRIHAGGFSTIDIATIVSNTANKFLMDGWNAVDQTCLRISKIQPVSNFQQITTVSLTDSLRFEQVGSGGEIQHGTLDELTYTNQADTYAKMLAITRKDIINDNLGALNDVPRKLGNGAIKLLNHIFWTEFLSGVSTSFFAAGNSNINTGVADMTVGGLDATETIFMNQTNPDGTPLGVMPEILLVPTALKNKAITLMGSQGATFSTSYATAAGDDNPFRGRFRVESSPYISNSSYTGNTSTAWWMLAGPNVLPVIAIAALNGRVEPTVETADADFNVLGIQMRGYSDVGVNFQEYRGGVHADGGSS